MNKILILTMAGRGERFGSSIPKQYVEINGVQLWEHPLKSFINSKMIDKIILVVDSLHIDEINNKVKNLLNVVVIEGGNTANESRFNALKYLKSINTPTEDIVIIHDAVRPYVNTDIIKNCISICEKYNVAIPIVSINDCLLETKEPIHAIQTPQAFRFGDIYNAHNSINLETTTFKAPCEIWKNYTNKPYYMFEGDSRCLKVTNKEDIELIKGLW